MTQSAAKFALLIATLACLTAPQAFAGKVYKWTDANGQVHFSQFPPEGQGKSAETVNIQTTQGNTDSGAQELNALRDKLKQDIDARGKRKEEAQLKEQEQAAAAENCKRAQKRLTMLKQGGRIYGMDEKGERDYYDEARMAKEIEQAQAAVKEYCK